MDDSRLNKKPQLNRVLFDSVFKPLPVVSGKRSCLGGNIIKPMRAAQLKAKAKAAYVGKRRIIVNNISKNPRIFELGDSFEGERTIMKNLGLDLGTKNIVISFREESGNIGFISETNGYWPFERVTPFIKNMLNDPTKVRSDGTKRPARWVELNGMAVVLGKDAEEFAYAKNDTLRRPMAEGGLSGDEEAMDILSIIVKGLLITAEHFVGKFENDMKLCYCTTAKAINKEINIDYHMRVVEAILASYETPVTISQHTIKESHAVVLDSSPDGTGIGISWGAGTVTVSYVKYGMDIFSFCWVGSGDWIDNQVAVRHGYDPNSKKKSKETPTTVAKRKMNVDLTPGKATERLDFDITSMYHILIEQVVDGIISGFVDNENEARIEDGINIYMAGGTSCPVGFTELFKSIIDSKKVPFEIADIVRTEDPLFTVARGCLKASEMF